jgi:putative transcriptional regulator
VLPAFKAAKNRSDPVFAGGPVEKEVVFSLLRSTGGPEAALHIFDGVYLIQTKPALEKALSSNRDPRTLRIYLGYCGWATDQLQNEVRLGAWHIFRGVTESVFDSEPASLWSRMIALTEVQIAESGRPSRSRP